MNQKEKEQLVRLHDLMSSVPFPTGMGMKTASMEGFVNYASDCREFNPWLSRIMTAILMKDTFRRMKGDPYFDPAEAEAADDPNDLLDAAESWVKRRKRDSWSKSSLRVEDCR